VPSLALLSGHPIDQIVGVLAVLKCNQPIEEGVECRWIIRANRVPVDHRDPSCLAERDEYVEVVSLERIQQDQPRIFLRQRFNLASRSPEGFSIAEQVVVCYTPKLIREPLAYVTHCHNLRHTPAIPSVRPTMMFLPRVATLRGLPDAMAPIVCSRCAPPDTAAT
jgi:hypothetical protein